MNHNISGADTITIGSAYLAGAASTIGGRGVPIKPFISVALGAPEAIDDDSIVAAVAVAAAGALTLDGADVASGVATNDVPRNIIITSAGDATTAVFTVTGTDLYGVPLVENITGVDTGVASGAKAFKTVTSVVASAAATGDIEVGRGGILGLPWRLTSVIDVVNVYGDTTEELASSTVVAGVATSPATAITGDVRGTVVPNQALDGAVEFVVHMFVASTSTSGALGVTQYGG